MATTSPVGDDKRSQRIWQPEGAGSRVLRGIGFGLKRAAKAVSRHVPGLAEVGNAPRIVPLVSDHRRMEGFSFAPYGTPEKPAELGEIPWDYVEENWEDIPFLGLREHWYPCVKSSALRHNESLPVKMLGDHVVVFRDAEGSPRAIQNRCGHRGPLLSLGQVGVWEPGTITCRYHGMTYDGDGQCVAVLADGPESPACGKAAYAVRSYPTEEVAGMVFVYMGEKEPRPVLECVPHLAELLDDDHVLMHYTTELPISHLNMLDNEVDLSHVSCAHRTCLFGLDQKLHGTYGLEDRPGGGFASFYTDEGENPHMGPNTAHTNTWYPPGLVYFPPGALGADANDRSYFWAVPRDVGHCAPWIIICRKRIRPRWLDRIVQKLAWYLGSGAFLRWPGSPVSCLHGTDRALMVSQGRVARWDRDKLLATDRSTVEMRKRMKAMHRAERAEASAPVPFQKVAV